MIRKINNKVALIEYGGSHTECMYIQIKALKDKKYDIYLICNKSLIKRFQDLSIFEDVLLLNDVNRKLSTREKLEDVRKVRLFIQKHNIRSVVINTLENTNLNRILIFSFSHVRNFIALVHDGSYINRSGTFKWLYRRVKKILVLSENIVKNIKDTPRKILLDSFYPIYFPSHDYTVYKPEGEFWVTIPGFIIRSRRDIIHLIDKIKSEQLHENIKIIFLGSIENEVRQMLNELLDKGNKNIIIFDSFIPQDVFDAYMRQTDVMLPLIMEDFYNLYRISGTYNLAYAYQKPMLLEKNIQCSNEDFTGISLPYERDNIIEVLNSVSSKADELAYVASKYKIHPFLTVDKQSGKFISIIEKQIN